MGPSNVEAQIFIEKIFPATPSPRTSYSKEMLNHQLYFNSTSAGTDCEFVEYTIQLYSGAFHSDTK